MHLRLTLTALLTLSACSALAQAQTGDRPLTLVSWGGAFMEAQRRALFTPFEARFDRRIATHEYRGNLALLRAQIAAGEIEWDVIAVDERGAGEGCRENLFEKLDGHRWSGGFNDTPADEDFIDGALHECALGSSVRALLFFTLADAFTTAPQSPAEVFDTRAFPGKRALPRTPRGNLEWALMADGVPPPEVYAELQRPGGVQRALGRLSALHPHIKWWRKATEAALWLTDGSVTIAAAHHDVMAQVIVGTPVVVVPMWSGQLWEIDYWAIVKGTPHAHAAGEFLDFATGTLRQVEFARISSHGPVRRSALSYTQPSVAAWLPSAGDRLQRGLRIDAEWWARNGAQLDAEFRAWFTALTLDQR